MRYGFLVPVVVVFAGAGVTLAQAPPPGPEADQEIMEAGVRAHKKERGHRGGGDGPSAPNPLTPADLCPPEPQTAPVISLKDEPNAFEAPRGSKDAVPGDCTPGCHFWLSAEHLVWFVKEGPTAGPLVSSNATGVASPALNVSGTSVAFPTSIDYGPFAGGRFTAGFANADQSFGVELVGLVLEERSKRFATASGPGGSPALGRPVVDALTGMETTQL